MIRLDEVSLKYDDKVILKEINIEIKEPGIYVLGGESGSGKSSLLNILSLMETRYEGEYYLDEENVSSFNDEERTKARFELITYLFQIPKLIESETIKVNIEIALGRKISKKEELSYLKKIHMNPSKKRISSLSGGEKQRVNILIGLLRNTPIILGDEITSGLDELNKKIIMSLLKEEAKKKIIILVTHDVEWMKKYAKTVLMIENNTVEKVKKTRGRVIKNEDKRRNKLPLSYIFSHASNVLSLKKVRTLISLFSSTIALVCLGICLLLTESLKDSIMSSFSDSFNNSTLIMRPKEQSFLLEENISIDKKDALDIKKTIGSDISYLGVNYLTDIDPFFQDENYASFHIDDRFYNFQDVKASSIKDFIYIEKEDIDLFYLSKKDLQEDEIIVSFTHGEISRMCTYLNIEYHDDSSLMDYLKYKPLVLDFFMCNESWDYQIDFSLNVVGYIIASERNLYHTYELWNEYVIEEILQLASSLRQSEIDYYPWTLKKEYYLYIPEEKIGITMKKIYENEDYDDYVPFLKKKEYGYRLSFKYAHSNYLTYSECNKIIRENDDLLSYISCSNEGYNAIEEIMMSGFAYPMFISSNYELLEDYINMNSYSEENLGMFQSTILEITSEDIISLSLLDASKKDFCKLKIDNSTFNDINNINISRGLARRLKIDERNITEPIFIMGLKSIEYANSKYKNNFEIVRMHVDNIYEDEEESISSNYLWVNNFLMSYFDKKSMNIEKIIIDTNTSSIEALIKELNMKYIDYEFINPYLDYVKSLDEMKNYIVIGLSIFSSFSLMASLLMQIVSSSLFISESKREIGIYTLYGYKKKNIKVLYKVYSYFLSLYSLIISYLCLILSFALINRGNTSIHFNSIRVLFKPFFIMFIMSFLIGFITSRTSTYRVFKENPLRQLHER